MILRDRERDRGRATKRSREVEDRQTAVSVVAISLVAVFFDVRPSSLVLPPLSFGPLRDGCGNALFGGMSGLVDVRLQLEREGLMVRI